MFMTTARLAPFLLSVFACVSPFVAGATVAKTSPASARVAEASPSAGPHVSAKGDNRERRALTIVKSEYKKYGKNVSGLKRDCVKFEVGDTTAGEITILEREVHSAQCGGTPGKRSEVAKFVVRGADVFIQDPVSNKLVAFDENFKSDGP